MGYPMAGHLATAGHRVSVYNRTPSRAAKWIAQHGNGDSSRAAPAPGAAAADADIVMMCVGNDDDVRAVALGAAGALASMRAGSVLVDHTTASAALARELHKAAAGKDVGFIDAPSPAGRQAPRAASSRSCAAVMLPCLPTSSQCSPRTRAP
jgi:3-hydroxyisobutyrate dehydrogenase